MLKFAIITIVYTFMNQKIFEALKQAYSHLGLGDELLQSFASGLALTGIVTDDNLEAVVNAQKGSLEAIQKANDKRAEDAAKKAKEKAEAEAKKQAEELKAAAEKQKAEEEAAKKAEADKKAIQEADEKGEAMPEWFKAYQTAQDEKYNEALKRSEKLENTLKDLQDENSKFKAEQNAAKRDSFIASESKRLGVPEWRAKEGFNISSEMDDKAITEYLSVVANNIKKFSIPEDKSGFSKFDGKVTKEEVDKLADNLLK